MIDLRTQTPNEYNGGQLDLLPQYVSLDYLNINYKGVFDIDSLNGDFTHEIADYAGKIFSKGATILYKDIKFCDVVWSPRSSALEAGLIQIRIHNLWLWVSDWWPVLEQLTGQMAILYTSVNRVDICNDMHTFKGGISYEKLIKGWISDDYLLKGRSKKVQFSAMTKEGSPIFQGFSLGQRDGERFVRVYNKTLELESNPKDYIPIAWSIAGLDTSRDVYRLEVQLNNKFLRKLEHFDLWQLTRYDYVLGLLDIGLKNYFEFVVNTSKTEVNKNPSLDLTYYFELLGTKKDQIKKYVKTKLNNVKNSIRSKAITAKSILREYVNNWQDEIYAITLSKFLDVNDIGSLFLKRYEYWMDDIRKDLINPYPFDQQKFADALQMEI